MNINEHKFLIGSAMILIAAVVLSSALFWLGSSFQKSNGQSTQKLPSLANTLPPGTPNPANALPQYSNTLSPIVGQITAADSQSITVAGTRVFVDKNTEIYTKGAMKDPQAYAQERDAFVKSMQYSTSSASVVFVGPDPFVHVPQTIADLKIGVAVSVSPKKSVDGGVLAQSIFIMK